MINKINYQNLGSTKLNVCELGIKTFVCPSYGLIHNAYIILSKVTK